MRDKITPDTAEVRSVDPVTGGEKGAKECRVSLSPVAPLEEIAKHFGRGAAKYSDRNYELGYAYSLSFDAAMRHLLAWWDGERLDGELGSHHLAAAAFHLIALMEFEHRGSGADDRPAGNVTDLGNVSFIGALTAALRDDS